MANKLRFIPVATTARGTAAHGAAEGFRVGTCKLGPNKRGPMNANGTNHRRVNMLALTFDTEVIEIWNVG